MDYDTPLPQDAQQLRQHVIDLLQKFEALQVEAEDLAIMVDEKDKVIMDLRQRLEGAENRIQVHFSDLHQHSEQLQMVIDRLNASLTAKELPLFTAAGRLSPRPPFGSPRLQLAEQIQQLAGLQELADLHVRRKQELELQFTPMQSENETLKAQLRSAQGLKELVETELQDWITLVANHTKTMQPLLSAHEKSLRAMWRGLSILCPEESSLSPMASMTLAPFNQQMALFLGMRHRVSNWSDPMKETLAALSPMIDRMGGIPSPTSLCNSTTNGTYPLFPGSPQSPILSLTVEAPTPSSLPTLLDGSIQTDDPSQVDFGNQTERAIQADVSNQTEGTKRADVSNQTERAKQTDTSNQTEIAKQADVSNQTEGATQADVSNQTEWTKLADESNQTEGPRWADESNQTEGPDPAEEKTHLVLKMQLEQQLRASADMLKLYEAEQRHLQFIVTTIRDSLKPELAADSKLAGTGDDITGTLLDQAESLARSIIEWTRSSKVPLDHSLPSPGKLEPSPNTSNVATAGNQQDITTEDLNDEVPSGDAPVPTDSAPVKHEQSGEEPQPEQLPLPSVPAAYLGIELARDDPTETERSGLRVIGVRGPAEKAGIVANDWIVQLDDRPVNSLTDFVAVAMRLMPDQIVQVSLVRDGEPMTIPVQAAKLEVRPLEATPSPRSSSKDETGQEAVADETPSPSLKPAAQIGIEIVREKSGDTDESPTSQQPVKVARVKGPAKDARIMPGDIILSLNEVPVRCPADFRTASLLVVPGKPVRIKLSRGDRRMVVSLMPTKSERASSGPSTPPKQAAPRAKSPALRRPGRTSSAKR